MRFREFYWIIGTLTTPQTAVRRYVYLVKRSRRRQAVSCHSKIVPWQILRGVHGDLLFTRKTKRAFYVETEIDASSRQRMYLHRVLFHKQREDSTMSISIVLEQISRVD